MSCRYLRASRTSVRPCQRDGKCTKSSVDLLLHTCFRCLLNLFHTIFLIHRIRTTLPAHSTVNMAQHLSNTPIKLTDSASVNTAAPRKPAGGGGGEPPRRPGRDATRDHYLQAMSLWEIRKQCVHWLFLTHTYRT